MMGRKPADCTFDFNGVGYAISGTYPLHGENLTQIKTNTQGVSLGNRIGHDPKSPKKFVSPANHKRPPTISDLIRDFSHSYFKPKLNKRFYHHLDTDRQIRSEFREMISMGCSIIAHYYDVMSGELGFRDENGKHVRLSYRQLATMLNVSLIRVKRFFDFLKKRDLVTIIEDKKLDEKGNWKSNVSRKIINPKFFIDTLGIDAWRKIKLFKDYLFKKITPKTKKQKENVSMVASLMNHVGSAFKKSSGERKVNFNKEQQQIKDAMAAFESDPSRSLGDWLRYIKSKQD